MGKFLATFISQCCLRNGFISSLPQFDILLLSKVTLRQCKIRLHHFYASLIPLTSRIRIPLGWKHQFWCLSHEEIGGYIDDHRVLHLTHRLYKMVAPLYHTDKGLLLSGNIKRVLFSTISNVKLVPPPSTGASFLVDNLFPLGIGPHFFTVYSVFSKSGWCRRRLSLDEILHLFDYPT